MKKILKSKKGFTLIELLAVIVVLAIIMVIATQQVNRTIKKARTNSFIESMQSVVKTAKLLSADDNLSTAELRNNLDYSKGDYEVYVFKGGFDEGEVTCNKNDKLDKGFILIVANESGKFNNIDKSLITVPNDFRLWKHTNGAYQIATYLNNVGETSTNGINEAWPTDAQLSTCTED